MSYDVVKEKTIPCPCKEGVIRYSLSENDWNQTRESITIECHKCKEEYRIVSESYRPKPKHDFTLYYLVPRKGNGEKNLLDF